MKFVAIVGSNADQSYNRMLLQFMQRHFKIKCEIELLEIKDVPMFNQDEDQSDCFAIRYLNNKITRADGVIIATPEHNHTITPALKSTLEWLSFKLHPLENKPVMIVGASYYDQGTSRAQVHLRKILEAPGVNAYTLPGNEFLLGKAKEAFDLNGNISNEGTIKFLESCLDNFIKYVEVVSKLRKPRPIEPEDLWKALLQWIAPRQPDRQAVQAAPEVLQTVRLPSAIEGLDMVAGLRRVLGKKPVYLAMLRRFVAGQQSVLTNIGNALDGEDNPLAERLAHTLKGASGTIGATGVQQMAAALEAAIQQHSPREVLEAHLAAVRTPLDTLLAHLERALPAEVAAVVVAADLARIQQVCTQLSALLAEGDSEASDVFEAHADLLGAAFPAQFAALAAAVRAFDFPTALVALGAAVGTLSGRASP